LALFFNLTCCKFGVELYIFARELDLPRPKVEPRLLYAHTREQLPRAHARLIWVRAGSTLRAGHPIGQGYPVASSRVYTSKGEDRGCPLYANPTINPSPQTTVYTSSKNTRCSRTPQICHLSDSSLTPTPRSYSERSSFHCISIQ